MFGRGATSDEHKVNGLQSGADEYLVKPFGIQELLARVQTLVRLRNATPPPSAPAKNIIAG